MLMEVLILPAGALLGISCVLTGSRRLQTFAKQLADVTIKLGKLPLTLAQLFLTFSTLRFVMQCVYVSHCQSKLNRYRQMQEEGTSLVTSEVEDKLKASVWRAERNFWITLFSLGLWIVYIRSCQIITKLRHKIDLAYVKRRDLDVKAAEAKTPPTEESSRESAMPKGAEKESNLRARVQ